jgi:hypothetical protein
MHGAVTSVCVCLGWGGGLGWMCFFFLAALAASDVNHYPNGTYVCDRACYDTMCSHDAHDFMTWATSDPRIAGVFPWNWAGCPSCNGSKWTPPHTCWWVL